MKMKDENSHRRVLTEFIQLYRSEPCLWMTKSVEYRDRHLKEAAYERLAAKLREIDTTADRDKVVKKINSLRTNYRKEKKKMEEASEEAPYTPRLWYYTMFDFLEGHEIPGPNPFDTYDSRDTFEDYEENGSDPLTEIYHEIDDIDPAQFEEQQQQELQQEEIKQKIQEQIQTQLQQEQQVRELEREREREREKLHQNRHRQYQEIHCEIRSEQGHQLNNIRLQNLEKIRSAPQSHAGSVRKISTFARKKANLKRAFLQRSSDESDSPSPLARIRDSVAKKQKKDEDRHDVFARMVAMKLRFISDQRQRVLAEKAINDALFLAEMGELTVEHVNSPLNISQTPSEIEYSTSSTNRIESAPAEHEENGVRILYANEKQF